MLEGTAPASALEGGIVLVGAKAAVLDRGLATPAHPALPGVELHAAARGRATHFDPAAVDALLAAAEQWRGLGAELAEGPKERRGFTPRPRPPRKGETGGGPRRAARW